jgi:intracellular septation protein A
MKALSDLIAVILFFAIYLFSKNMVAATAVAVAVGVLQAAYTLWKHRRMSVMQWIGLITIVVFGGATILLNDRMFFMLKTTILTWLSALVMLASQLMGKNGLKLMLGQELQLPETVWNRLGWAWVVFFIVLGAVNLAVAYPFSAEREALWVNFKVYGYLPLTIAFAIGQGIYLSRHLPKEES